MDSGYQGSRGGGDGYDGYYGGRSSSRGGMDRRDEMPPPRGEDSYEDLGGGRGFRGTPENAKTKMCMRWMAGDCRFGDRCNFAHGETELRRSLRREEPPYYDDRNGYRDSYYESRSSYRDYRDPPPRDYDGSPPRRGERSSMHGSSGYYSSRGHPYAPPSRYGGRGDGPHSRGDRDYYPPSRGSGGDSRGASYHHKGDDEQHSPSNRPNYSDKPSGMSDEVWASSGYPVPGPNNWWRYTTEKGEHYYHNYRSNATQWDKPEGWTIVTVNH
eukprot:TRINITY_DN1744_c0_g2_i1.p1 TRINITY_DN1744_c0_g2~~TRINITY_DN1744_c0_g2_i1.p1  ORF type:complete len:270 (+),score=41.63 TRINITY_DN1744_c0_g2_i1:207-1016(+)